MDKNFEINSRICSKENSDLVYSITGKKHLNGILHYQLESESGKIYLSEFAVKDRFLRIEKNEHPEKHAVSKLYTKITETVNKS